MSKPEEHDPTWGRPIVDVVAAEALVIEAQRQNRGVSPAPERRIGLALSGGGIRSASFALGVLQALNRKNRLIDVDYLSTVSGGGYIGSALTWYRHVDLLAGKGGSFPFGEKGQSHCAAVTGKGEEVDTQPDRTAFARQHGEYLAPSKKLTTTSLIASVVRNAVVTFAVYAGMLLALTILIVRTQATWEVWLGATLVGDLVPSSLRVSAAFFALFCVLSAVYALQTWIYPYFFPGNRQLYTTRILGQQVMGWAFGGFLVALLLGSIPHAAAWLHGWKLGTAGTSLTLTGLIGVVIEFIKQQRPQIVKLWPRISGLVTWVGASALIYGMLLLSYEAAISPFIEAHPAAVWYLIGATVVLGTLMNSNMFSIARMYRDRLMEAFMPDPAAVKSRRWEPAYEADIGFLKDVCGTGHPGPYHLINTNVVLTSSDYPQFRGRGGDNFVMSSLYCGSEATGWHPTADFCGGNMTLATAMAISGAAVNPNAGCGGQGPTRNRLAAFMLALFNIRLGYWVRNPHARQWFGKFVSHLWPNLLYPGLRQGLLGTGLHVRAGFIELTDGGHFDNTGIYELVRRRVHIIILSLASADPSYGYDDLADVIERVRVDFGVLIQVPDLFEGTAPGSRLKAALGIGASLKLSERGHSIGLIQYPGDDRPGQLIVLKATATGGLPIDVLRYAAGHSEFPNESTADQFFDERQFEAYRETGYAATRTMLEENGRTNWF